VEDGGRPAVRDYYVAESPEAGLVWISANARPPLCIGRSALVLQGLYA
jgi:protein ImuB